MDQPQLALQGSAFCGQSGQLRIIDLISGKQSVQFPFILDELLAGADRRLAHSILDLLYLPCLLLGELQFLREIEHMPRPGIMILLGSLGHAMAYAFFVRLNLLGSKRLNGAIFGTWIG